MKIDKKLSVESQKSGYNEHFSTILYMLYKVGTENKKYSTLSELPFVLDGQNLLNLLEFYGGKTITIPTKQELLDMTTALTLYDIVDINSKPLEDAIQEVGNINKRVLDYYADIHRVADEEVV